MRTHTHDCQPRQGSAVAEPSRHRQGQRTPLLVFATALVVGVLGATPLGHAAGERLAAAVPFSKSAGYATLAGNATKLNGGKSTLAGAPGTIPIVGHNGKLPTSLGAVVRGRERLYRD